MEKLFARIASEGSRILGHPISFIVSTLLIILWAASGPLLKYSDTWQLIVNTATTVLTFLAVFLIQNSQNRDGAAMQAKLDELLRAIETARGEFVGIEHLTESEIVAIRDALEKQIAQEDGKRATADGTVERLLKRLG
jgi:low affinity Fe/Cu permease